MSPVPYPLSPQNDGDSCHALRYRSCLISCHSRCHRNLSVSTCIGRSHPLVLAQGFVMTSPASASVTVMYSTGDIPKVQLVQDVAFCGLPKGLANKTHSLGVPEAV